jgi:type III secretion protein T
MEAWRDLSELKSFFWGLAWTQPRILSLFIAIPVFHAELMPTQLRLAIAVALGLVLVPRLMPEVDVLMASPPGMLMILAKEVLIGFALGCLIAVPFWVLEAVGFFIDNQRGASIASTLNPLTGNDSSPLGILFNQAFIVFFMISGGFLLMLEVLYGSFLLWPVSSWLPQLQPAGVGFFLHEILGLVKLALLLASPAIVAMLLAEIGLALVSLVVPQLQVFFLAMAIKSALVFFVLMIYMATLFDYAGDLLTPMRDLLPRLDAVWRSAGEAAR